MFHVPTNQELRVKNIRTGIIVSQKSGIHIINNGGGRTRKEGNITCCTLRCSVVLVQILTDKGDIRTRDPARRRPGYKTLLSEQTAQYWIAELQYTIIFLWRNEQSINGRLQHFLCTNSTNI